MHAFCSEENALDRERAFFSPDRFSATAQVNNKSQIVGTETCANMIDLPTDFHCPCFPRIECLDFSSIHVNLLTTATEIMKRSLPGGLTTEVSQSLVSFWPPIKYQPKGGSRNRIKRALCATPFVDINQVGCSCPPT